MTEKEVIEASKRKHIRQPPSVPFLWEEKPGIAKKDWKPVVSSVTTLALPPPVKLIASVPFNWEEEPGKPLQCFSQPSMESPPPTFITLPSPPMYYYHYEFNNEKSAGHDNHREKEGIFEFEIESFSLETDDSLSSEPSLLANCLVSSSAVSSAVPVLDSPPTKLETSSSPASDTDSSISSYATGISSLTGASFLECLFPLYAPNSGFPDTLAHSKKDSLPPTELQNSNFDHENDSSVMAKRAPTLGELIMMSRRRSCQRKAIQMRNQNLSMEFMNTKSFSCWTFGTGITMFEGWQKKRHHARLKLT